MIAVWLVGIVVGIIMGGGLIAKLTWPTPPGRHRAPKRIPADEMAEVEAWLEQIQNNPREKP